MRVAFYHDIEDPAYWKDGLWAALEVLKADFDFTLENPDVILLWTGSQGRHINTVRSLPQPKIWLFAGGVPDVLGMNTTVVEDEYARRQFSKLGVEARIAFGTNTSLFKPRNIPKKYDVIFPGAFARWKRHELLIEWAREAGTQNVLVVGHKQDVETECYEACEQAGFSVHNSVLPEELATLYNESHECWIPSETIGGSQRTLLEARACGLPVRVAPDNPRLTEMLTQPVPSHYEYAHRLRAIINEATPSPTQRCRGSFRRLYNPS
jgi:glycosyltransferase involved in cell wall biosynthesis